MSGQSENGAALIAVLLAMALLAALGGGLLQVMATESSIVLHHRYGLEALYAAEALVERVRGELTTAPDVNALLEGPVRSSLVDGSSGGVRAIDGATIDLSELTNVERCGRVTTCSDAAIRTVTGERPRGADNPRWRLFAHEWLQQVVGSADVPPVYLIAWIGDDPFEADGDPLRDGAGPGQGMVALRVRAYGRKGARREIDVVIAGLPDHARVVRWIER